MDYYYNNKQSKRRNKTMKTLMKTLIITIALATSMVAFGKQFKYSDVYELQKHHIESYGIDTNKTYELKDIKAISTSFKQSFVESEYFNDDFTLNYFNNIKNAFYLNNLDAKKFPKTLNAVISTYSPAKKTLCLKYELFDLNFDKISANDLIEYLKSGEFKSSDIQKINESLKNAGLKVVKKWLRKNGKSFVAKKDAKGNIIDNPLTAPMKELTDALNGAKYAGINEWSAKYGANWETVEFPWLLSDEKLAELKDNILIDEEKFSDENVKQLRVSLGVDGFNAFVKLYNEGTETETSEK